MDCGWVSKRERGSDRQQGWCGVYWMQGLDWAKGLCHPRNAACRQLPLACLLGRSLGSWWPPSPWCSPSTTGAGKPSLTVRVRGVLLCTLFCCLWVEVFFLMALHEKYSIKFCILLQGCAKPNLKSAECVWSHLGCHHTLGAFVKFVSWGPTEYGKAHCKMQASDLELVFKPISSGHVPYDSIYVIFWKWHFKDEERISDCQGLRVLGMRMAVFLKGVAQGGSLWWWDSCLSFFRRVLF